GFWSSVFRPFPGLAPAVFHVKHRIESHGGHSLGSETRAGRVRRHPRAPRTSLRENDDPPVGLRPGRIRPDSVDLRDRVVHDLALERGHRVHLLRISGLQHPLRSHPAGLRQSLPLGGAPPGDVEHQSAPVAELALHSQAGELLYRIENLPFGTDELLQIVAPVDAHHRAITLDVQVDVPVEVEDVQQLLEVVAGDLALLDKTLFRHHDVLAGHRPASVTTADHSASVDAEPFPPSMGQGPRRRSIGDLIVSNGRRGVSASSSFSSSRSRTASARVWSFPSPGVADAGPARAWPPAPASHRVRVRRPAQVRPRERLPSSRRRRRSRCPRPSRPFPPPLTTRRPGSGPCRAGPASRRPWAPGPSALRGARARPRRPPWPSSRTAGTAGRRSTGYWSPCTRGWPSARTRRSPGCRRGTPTASAGS